MNELSALAAFMALGNSEVLYSFIKAPANAGNLAIWAPVAVSILHAFRSLCVLLDLYAVLTFALPAIRLCASAYT